MSRPSSEVTYSVVNPFFSEFFQQHAVVSFQLIADELQVSPATALNPVAAVIRLWGSAEAQPDAQSLQQLLALLPAQPLQARLLQPHPALAPALELRLSQGLAPATVIALRELAVALALELNYLTHQPQLAQPGLLVMDMDSTAIEIECIDEIAALAGVGPQVSAVTAAAMRGELDFAQSLRQRVAALQGAPEQVLADVLATLPLMPGLETLVATLHRYGWTVAIASGGFTYFTQALQQRLGLAATFANVLDIKDGKLTGQVLGGIVDAQVKAQVVQQLAAARDIPHGQTVAIGDGANDLPMLAVAGLGVAFHAKPLVQAKADYAIRHGSLLQLLYLFDPAEAL